MDIFVHVVIISIILYSIWLIRKTWSKGYRKETSENIERKKHFPSYILWPAFRNPQNSISYMKFLSIAIMVIALVSEVFLIIYG